MKEMQVDVAIVGAGTAGLSAFRAAKASGRRVLLVEGGQFGTTCARVGCMPSKLLIAAADSAHAVHQAHALGVHAGQVRIDGWEVMSRVRRERDRFVGGVLESVDAMDAADKLHGHARFSGPQLLEVGGHTRVRAKAVVLATGSRPMVPDALQGAGERVLTSDDIFELTTLPRSLAVVGAGAIGLELGQALARLGVAVTIYARGHALAGLSDPEVVRALAGVLGQELDLRLGHDVVHARREGDDVLLSVRDKGGHESAAHHQYVLAATGRAPNVEGLGLELAGIALDRDGVPLFAPRTMQCGDSAVFIAGDAAGERQLLAEASDQGRIAGENAARFPDVRPGLRRAPLAIAFTDPNSAIVGDGYHSLCRGGRPRFAIGSVSFSNQGRSRVMMANRGLLRVYAEFGSGRFLGAEMAAPRGEHLAHTLAWACQARMDVRGMLAMPFYHPVIEEGMRTALRELASSLGKGEPREPGTPDCTPGT